MRPNKVYSLLGLATKAGKMTGGEFMTERAVKDGSAWYNASVKTLGGTV